MPTDHVIPSRVDERLLLAACRAATSFDEALASIPRQRRRDLAKALPAGMLAEDFRCLSTVLFEAALLLSEHADALERAATVPLVRPRSAIRFQ